MITHHAMNKLNSFELPSGDTITVEYVKEVNINNKIEPDSPNDQVNLYFHKALYSFNKNF